MIGIGDTGTAGAIQQAIARRRQRKEEEEAEGSFLSDIAPLAGSGGGAALGAILGSVVPGVGTLIGAGLGSAAGGLVGGAVPAVDALTKADSESDRRKAIVGLGTTFLKGGLGLAGGIAAAGETGAGAGAAPLGLEEPKLTAGGMFQVPSAKQFPYLTASQLFRR